MSKFIIIVMLYGTITSCIYARAKVIHIFVALCDNKSQGIVPVPANLGNGDDPANNLYWGAMYGIKTFFKRSKEWNLIDTQKNITPTILERIIFKHKSGDYFIIADAYKGSAIKQAIIDFLSAASGKKLNTPLIAYIGHNGLMDFNINQKPILKGKAKLNNNPKSIVLACKSKAYFKPLLDQAKSEPLLLTTNFMAPEAYTLEAAFKGYIIGEDKKKIAERAAQAYKKYQKCGINGARRLFDINPTLVGSKNRKTK